MVEPVLVSHEDLERFGKETGRGGGAEESKDGAAEATARGEAAEEGTEAVAGVAKRTSGASGMEGAGAGTGGGTDGGPSGGDGAKGTAGPEPRPQALAEVQGPTSETKALPSFGSAVVQHSFEGDATEHQLTVGAGEVVERLASGDEDGWAWVRSSGGEEGFVPAAYLG